MPLQEMQEAQTALAAFFDRLWPGPSGPENTPELLGLQELEELERRYRQAQQVLKALEQNVASETGASRTELLQKNGPACGNHAS